LGADDYLTKPFSMNEFVARVGSLIRRYTAFNGENSMQSSKVLFFDGLVITPSTREVLLYGKRAELTAKEFELLYFLASNQGKIFTKNQIYTHVWGTEYVYDDSNIMSFISKLRKKMESNNHKTAYIQTVRGVGYRFKKEV
jgi:DNA-binding response OmpR family regulator